jgi:Ca2+-binding EF-hand superfamily protein
MGNKEAKFKKMYEEIDISGNREVGFNELAAFIISDKVVEVLKEFSDIDISAIEKEFNEMDEADADGKLTFEEFMEAMKKNKTISKLILKMADSNAT